jgi:hypothetical protein
MELADLVNASTATSLLAELPASPARSTARTSPDACRRR